MRGFSSSRSEDTSTVSVPVSMSLIHTSQFPAGFELNTNFLPSGVMEGRTSAPKPRVRRCNSPFRSAPSGGIGKLHKSTFSTRLEEANELPVPSPAIDGSASKLVPAVNRSGWPERRRSIIENGKRQRLVYCAEDAENRICSFVQ